MTDELEDSATKARILTDIAMAAEKYNGLFTAIRLSRNFWCNKPELEAMSPTFTYVANQLESGLMEHAATISRLYSEYNSLGKRR